MRTRIALIAAAALAVAGCGNNDKCPTESPQVNTVGSCQALAGTTVNFPIRLCPTCNQTFSTCEAQVSGSQIFLNPTVEACSSSNSCAPGCAPNPATCTFTAPNVAAPASYTVLVFDPLSNTTKQGTLDIVSSSPSCSLL